MTIRRPAARNVAKASGVLALMGSETANRPFKTPSTARCITLAPSMRVGLQPGVTHHGGHGDAQLFHQGRIAQGQLVVLATCAAHAYAGAGFEASRACPRTMPRSRAARTMLSAKRVFAALIQTGRQAQDFVGLSNPGHRYNAVKRRGGLPSSVPVLSMMRVSTLRRFSMAAASRNKTPWVALRAPWPP
jgi:hypothetical protein